MKRDPEDPERWAKPRCRSIWWRRCHRCHQEFRWERHFSGRLRFIVEFARREPVKPWQCRSADLCLACAEELAGPVLPAEEPGKLRLDQVADFFPARTRRAAGRYFRDWKPERPVAPPSPPFRWAAHQPEKPDRRPSVAPPPPPPGPYRNPFYSGEPGMGVAPEPGKDQE